MTTAPEPSRLGKLKAQYRQVVLREKIHDEILRTMDRHFSPEADLGTVRSPRSRSFRWPLIASAITASALAATVLLLVGARGSHSLEVVVSAVSGQAFSDGESTRMLSPKLHVPEGQRLRTSASSRLETQVGAHRVAVSPESSLLLESLQPQDLVFRLERGQATWSVSRLGPGGHLRVLAGDVSVEVVGTVFTVERHDSCSSVSVQSGRVAISHQGTLGQMQAGESRRFCPAAGRAPVAGVSESTPADTERDTLRQPEKKEQPAGPVRMPKAPSSPPARRLAWSEGTAAPPVATTPARTESLSEEERLFRDASQADSSAWVRARRLQDYLGRFPEGTFAEDALFQLIRLSYAEGNPTQVIRLGDQFLRRHQHGRRAHQVQLLYVQSSIESSLPPGQSLPVLESLLPHLGALPPTEREQATYLAILAYCSSRKTQLCAQWSGRYLEEFPHGAYAAEVRRNQMEGPRRP
jgi:hypothetical protein